MSEWRKRRTGVDFPVRNRLFPIFVTVLQYQSQVRKISVLAIPLICLSSLTTLAQSSRPGLPGMAPTRWITFRNTHAPGRVFQNLNSNARTYTHEDTYIKAYIPLAMKSRFTLAVAPHYRSEELELKDEDDDMYDQMASWRLRSIGLDIKSMIQLDTTSWLVASLNINQAGNIDASRTSSIPLSYTASATFIQRKSANKEVGYGLLVNKANSFLILPVFIYNYNFSSRVGIEISLPHKIAGRYNLSPTDILYVKAEGNTRTYFLGQSSNGHADLFRRIDIDMGVSYNKQFFSLVGAEIFAGYRQNLTCRLPETITAVRNSGFVASLELSIRPPQGLLQKRAR